jgi:protein-glutamine gamma-glutamyltransferase
MRFGLVHRAMTNALAALGVLALVASGELGRWMNIAVLLGLLAAIAMPEAWHSKPLIQRLASFGAPLLLAIQLTRGFLGRTVLELAVEFAVALQIIRLATRRGAAHDQQVIVLALLHLIAGTVLGGGLGYGVCFLGFLVVAPGALVLSHLRREVEGNYRQGARDRTGLPVDVPRILRSRRVVGRTFLGVTCLLSLPILCFTGAVFLIFPRVGLSLLLLNRPHAGRMVGFSDRVDLGGVGTLRDDPTIAVRVEVPDLPTPPPERLALYLRGTAFDAYDGSAWSRTTTQRQPALRDGSYLSTGSRTIDRLHDRKFQIDLEAIDPPVLFLPPQSVGLKVGIRGETSIIASNSLRVDRGPEGEFRYRGADERGVRYEVFVSREPLPVTPLAKEDRARYLTTPNLPARIGQLAATVTGQATTPFEKAKAIEKHLRQGYKYDVASPSGNARQPLDHFLFESKRGHCEFYSTAMAMMLRYAGVPTRNVTGFVGGSYNRFGGFYAVRQGDAHSWVEAYIDGQGWMTFDPTPPSDAAPRSEIRGVLALLRDMLEASSQRWDRHVVGYNLSQQLSLLDHLRARGHKLPFPKTGPLSRRVVVPVVACVALLGIGYALWRRRRKAQQPATERSAREQRVTVVVSLYEALDAAMLTQGVPRPQGTPPLLHSESAAVRSHPMAEEIQALTAIYLEARFGKKPLDEAEKKQFERRVKAIRLAKRNEPTPALASGDASGRAHGWPPEATRQRRGACTTHEPWIEIVRRIAPSSNTPSLPLTKLPCTDSMTPVAVRPRSSQPTKSRARLGVMASPGTTLRLAGRSSTRWAPNVSKPFCPFGLSRATHCSFPCWTNTYARVLSASNPIEL